MQNAAKDFDVELLHLWR